ncbi:MAG: TIGR03087 family PEP-CTERM/XrtA system glycosyltransferase [Pseudomonadota bacterium]
MGRILFLAHRIPYPPNKGDKIRSYNILKALAAEHDVVCGAFVDDPDDLQHREALSAITTDLHLEPIVPKARTLLSLRGFATGDPLSVAYYHHLAFQRFVDEELKRGVDAIVLFSSAMARFIDFQTLGNVPVWMDFVDLDSDKWRQYAAHKSGPMGAVYRREAKRLFDFETAIARHATYSSFVTDQEVALFLAQSGLSPEKILAVHNGVDLDHFMPRDNSSASARIVFTGAMDYQANVDAVTWFVSDILPRIQSRRSDVEFLIVGSKPTPGVQALASHAGVSVTGFVEDIRDYIASAAVCVAPMRIARGVQNKVLEAMAMGRPVVATTAGFEGIKAQPGRDLSVADDPEQFAAEVDAIFANEERSKALGTAARRVMESGYRWDEALRPMLDFAAKASNGLF